MKDHVVHEWGFPELAPASIKNLAWCVHCPATLSLIEATRRLNATESLGAEDALMAAHTGQDNGLTEREAGRLRAYAAALEGEDG